MKKPEQKIPLEMRFGLAGKSKVRLESIKTPKFTTLFVTLLTEKKRIKVRFLVVI